MAHSFYKTQLLREDVGERAIARNAYSVKYAASKRPVTPMENFSSRTSISSASGYNNDNDRNLSSLSYTEARSRPTSGTPLSPLPKHRQHRPSNIVDLTSTEHDNEGVHRKSFLNRIAPLKFRRSGSLAELERTKASSPPGSSVASDASRRVSSGPTVRTSAFDSEDDPSPAVDFHHSKHHVSEISERFDATNLGERGEPDGREATPRPPTSDAFRPASQSPTSHLSSDVQNHQKSQRKQTSRSAQFNKKAQRLSEDKWFETEILPILSLLHNNSPRASSGSLAAAERVRKNIEVVRTLYALLDSSGYLGRTCPHRPRILKVLYQSLGNSNFVLLAQLLRVIFALRVSGSNLISALKIMNRLSRNGDCSDDVFLDDNLIPLFLDTVSSSDATDLEAHSLSMSTLRRLSSSVRIRDRLVKEKAITRCSLLLQHLVDQSACETTAMEKPMAAVLTSLLTAFRNLCEAVSSAPYIAGSSMCAHLLEVLQIWTKRNDPIVLLSARCLSKLSSFESCLERMVASEGLLVGTIVFVLESHHDNMAIVRRLLHCLASAVYVSERCRVLLADHFETILQLFFRYLHIYNDLEIDDCEDNEDGGDAGETEVNIGVDVLSKIVTVFANASASPTCGRALTKTHCSDLLLKLVGMTNTMNVAANPPLSIVVNSFVLLNNLSCFSADDSSFNEHRIEFTHKLAQFMWAGSSELVPDIFSVFGNLSRYSDVRDVLMASNVCSIALTLLQSHSDSIVYTACGVLINMTLDPKCRTELRNGQAADILLHVLADFGETAPLITLACRLLCNMSVEMKSAEGFFGKTTATALLTTVKQLKAEYEAKGDEDGVVDDLIQAAGNLILRIEEANSSFDELTPPVTGEESS